MATLPNILSTKEDPEDKEYRELFNDVKEDSGTLGDYNIDEIILTEENQEFWELFKKNKETYANFIAALEEAPINKLFDWVHDFSDFSVQLGTDDYQKFFSEFLPLYIILRNSWTARQFSKEYEHYINFKNLYYQRPRLRKCKYCGTDLSDEYAENLTADDLIADSKVTIICPHCNKKNYFIPSTGLI